MLMKARRGWQRLNRVRRPFKERPLPKLNLARHKWLYSKVVTASMPTRMVMPPSYYKWFLTRSKLKTKKPNRRQKILRKSKG